MWKFADASIHQDYCRELYNQLKGVDSADSCDVESGWEQLWHCQGSWLWSLSLVSESKQLLSPLLAAKQQAVLCNDSPSSCQKFRQCECTVRCAVRKLR